MSSNLDQNYTAAIAAKNPLMPKPGTAEHDALIKETAGACIYNSNFDYQAHLAVQVKSV
jgi:hypothetical protein